MAENKPNSRAKQTLQSSKEFAKTTRDNVAHETDKILEIITNKIVDCKISEKEAKLRTLADMYDENEVEAINALKSDEILEKKKLSEEYESIVKKQLQMLQADERGKQALQNEIAEIKGQQRKRSEALKARKKALLVEKERAKRIAALPPPLPRSVKLLLKEHNKNISEAPPDTYSFSPHPVETIEVEEFDESEDKENMDDDDYHKRRRWFQEESDRMAKIRFNEALKKDRRKQEHAQFLKEIENAEKVNRRQKARSVSDASWKVPCTLSDRLNHVDKQATMEDAVENVFKKRIGTKEHAIEDLDGYEDKLEAKYKSISETKMIDCVPNFVKENYSYLLEEERPCGRRFRSLDDSSEDLNLAYIESPTDVVNSSDKIAAVLNHLDQMMSESDEVYENQFKPLLEAEILKGDQPKLESFDKAVEANILRLPTEDKSVGVSEDMSLSPTSSTDLMNSGLMAFKRKNARSKIQSQLGYLGPLHQSPSWTEPQSSDTLGASSSSSYYYPLPPNHGQPVCNLCDSPNCKLPLVEDKYLHRDCVPMSRSREELPRQETVLAEDEVKAKISSYVQLVADKYLKKGPAEEKVQVSGAEEVPLDGRRDSFENQNLWDTNTSARKPSDVDSAAAFDGILQRNEKMTLAKIPPYSDKPSTTTAVSKEVFLQRCNEILKESLSNILSRDDETEAEVLAALKSAISDEVQEAVNRRLQPGEYVYHELSTIQEVDSALTNDSMLSRRDSNRRRDEDIDTTSVSLVDLPNSEASELAKNIQFVGRPPTETADSAQQETRPKTTPSEDSFSYELISGTLSNIQTPSPGLINGNLINLQTPSSRFHSSLQTPSSLRLSDIRSEVSTPSTLNSDQDYPQTPSTLLSEQSAHFSDQFPSLRISYGTPYSSTFKKKHIKPPHLTSLETLPKHFKEISNISSEGQTTDGRPVDDRQTVAKVPDDRQTVPKVPDDRQTVPKVPDDRQTVPKVPDDRQTVPKVPDDRQTVPKVPDDRQTVPKVPDVRSEVSTPSTLSSGKDYLQTPSTFLSEKSTHLSDLFPAPSYGTPYSSSFRMKNVKHPHLTSLETLPKYFREISNIHDSSSSQGKPDEDGQTAPKVEENKPSGQVFFPKDFAGQFPPDQSSGGSFKPMTTHSNSPSLSSDQSKHSNQDVQERDRRERSFRSESANSFKPMTPHLYISGLTEAYSKEKNSELEDFRLQYKLPGGSFQSLTPHSYISTTYGASQRQVSDSDQRGNQHRTPSSSQDGSGSGFQPMKTRSHISTPNYTSERQQSDQTNTPLQNEENTASGFQRLASHPKMLNPSTSSERQHQERDDRHRSRSPSPQGTAVSGFPEMTPHSFFSIPNLPSQGQDKRDRERENRRLFPSPTEGQTVSGFLRVAPHYYASTPNLPSHCQQDLVKNGRSVQEENNASGFQPPTTQSSVSSISDTSTPSIEELRHHSSTSLANLRFKIPKSLISLTSTTQSSDATDNTSEESYKSQRSKLGTKAQNYRNPDADVEDYMMGDGSYMHQETNIPIQISLKNKGLESMDKGSVKHGVKSPTKQQGHQYALKVPRSDIFVPQLSTADLAINDLHKSQLQNKATQSPLKSKVSKSPDKTFQHRTGSPIKQQSHQNTLKVPRSELFVPQLSSADLALIDLQKKQSQRKANQSPLKNKVSKSPDKTVRQRTESPSKQQKVPRSDLFVPQLSTADLATNDLQMSHFQKDCSSKAEIATSNTTQWQKEAKPSTSDFVPQLQPNDLTIAKMTNQISLKACSSDFFVPQLSPKDFPREQSRLQQGYFSGTSATGSTPSISSVSSSGSKYCGLAADHRLMGRMVSSSKDSSRSTSPCNSETPWPDSPNLILDALKRKYASSSSKASSASSTPALSQRSFSDISVSKITSQSTPLKTIEDIIQETGILDEPDLTLITTNLTIKPDSPDKTRHLSEKSYAREGNPMASAVQHNTSRTPAAGNCDSPSMMSFLQHEVSCFADSKAEASSNLNQNLVNEQCMNEDEFAGQKFTRNQPKKFDFKKRTKRLWNNLEEVKTRKLIEEKKKQLAENRLKMKAYSKVYKKTNER